MAEREDQVSEPEITLGIGVDKKNGRVSLDVTISGRASELKQGENDIRVRVFYDQAEAASLAMALVRAAQELDNAGPAVLPSGGRLVLPNGNTRKPEGARR